MPSLPFTISGRALRAYGEILPFFDVVGRAGSLAILAPRQDPDQARIETLLRHYSSDPA